MLQIALDYAAGGAAVLPLHTPGGPTRCSCRRPSCDHAGKHPRTMRGKDDATTDTDTVTRWWSMWPDANIGIRPPVGMAVLDVDPRNNGDAQLAAMIARLGPLPSTRTARTGSGGEHRWFLCHGDVVGHLAPGIDVKSHTGYLVVPPSSHASGGTYTWTDPGPIVEAPAYLRKLLARPAFTPSRSTGSGTPAQASGLLRVVAEAPAGKRNDRLYWACARAHEKGLDVTALIDAAVANGLDRHAAEMTAKSAENPPQLRDGGAA